MYFSDGLNTAIGAASFGEGTGQIWLENVACTGIEESLDRCLHDGIANQDCTHAMDAGVTCQGTEIRIYLSKLSAWSKLIEIQATVEHKAMAQVHNYV